MEHLPKAEGSAWVQAHGAKIQEQARTGTPRNWHRGKTQGFSSPGRRCRDGIYAQLVMLIFEWENWPN